PAAPPASPASPAPSAQAEQPTEETAPPPAPDQPKGRKASRGAGSDSARKPRPPRRKGPNLTPPPGAAPRPAGVPAHRITFAPGPDTLRRGINPVGVFDELRELGETRIETDPEAVPPLEELDPERCYMGWTITLETAADLDRIREVFLFLTEDSTVSIERPTE